MFEAYHALTSTQRQEHALPPTADALLKDEELWIWVRKPIISSTIGTVGAFCCAWLRAAALDRGEVDKKRRKFRRFVLDALYRVFKILLRMVSPSHVDHLTSPPDLALNVQDRASQLMVLLRSVMSAPYSMTGCLQSECVRFHPAASF